MLTRTTLAITEQDQAEAIMIDEISDEALEVAATGGAAVALTYYPVCAATPTTWAMNG
jgi:hypothetical protein